MEASRLYLIFSTKRFKKNLTVSANTGSTGTDLIFIFNLRKIDSSRETFPWIQVFVKVMDAPERWPRKYLQGHFRQVGTRKWDQDAQYFLYMNFKIARPRKAGILGGERAGVSRRWDCGLLFYWVSWFCSRGQQLVTAEGTTYPQR